MECPSLLMILHLDGHLRRLARGVARLKGTARSYDLQMLLRQATLGLGFISLEPGQEIV